MVETAGDTHRLHAAVVAGKRESWGFVDRIRILGQFIRVVENWQFLPAALLGCAEGPVVTYVTRSGLKIATRSRPPSVHLSDCYSIVENHGARKGWVLSRLAPSPVVIDIGAHIGSFAVRAARQAERIVCFEPDPANYDLLLRNLEENGLENAIAFRTAVASQDEHRYMIPGPTGATGRIATAGENGWFQVRAVSLQTAIEVTQRNEIDLVKMDCEGAEYEILAGTPAHVLRKVRLFFVELHQIPGAPQELSLCLRNLVQAGFELAPSEEGDLLAVRRDPPRTPPR